MKFYFPWDWDKHLDQIATLFEDRIRNYPNDFSEMIVIHCFVEEPISDDLALAICLPEIAESER